MRFDWDIAVSIEGFLLHRPLAIMRMLAQKTGGSIINITPRRLTRTAHSDLSDLSDRLALGDVSVNRLQRVLRIR